MPRKKCYGSEAEKQRAYRLRKAGLVLVEKEAVVAARSRETDEVSLKNLPVPVLANASLAGNRDQGEARESTKRTDDGSVGSYPKAIGIDETERCSSVDSQRRANLSRWDQKFEEDRPNWYIFGKVEKEKNCWKCGKKFSTRLEMNKFCSPKCKNEYLDTAFGKLRNQ